MEYQHVAQLCRGRRMCTQVRTIGCTAGVQLQRSWGSQPGRSALCSVQLCCKAAITVMRRPKLAIRQSDHRLGSSSCSVLRGRPNQRSGSVTHVATFGYMFIEQCGTIHQPRLHNQVQDPPNCIQSACWSTLIAGAPVKATALGSAPSLLHAGQAFVSNSSGWH